MRKTLAASLSVALVLMAPGPRGYDALAAEFSQQPDGAGAPAAGLGAKAPSALPALPPAAPGLPQGVGAPAPFEGGPLPEPGVNALPPAGEDLAQPGQDAARPNEDRALPVEAGVEKAAPAPSASPSRAPEASRPAQPALQRLAAAQAGETGIVGWLFDKLKNRAQKTAGVVLGSSGLGSSAVAAPLTGALLFQAMAPVEAAAPPSPISERLKGKFSLKEFDSSEKAYILAESIFFLGLSVYLCSLPVLVKALTGSAALTGTARLVHYWTQAGALLISGAIAERAPMKRILGICAVSRGMIFGVIGMAAMAGFLPWHGFLLLVAANALLVSVQTLIGLGSGDGAAKVFSSDKKIEKGVYLYGSISALLMLIVPPLLGRPMDLLSARFGPAFGAGAGYAAVGLLMGLSAWIYTHKVKVVNETLAARWSDLASSFNSFWAALSPRGALAAIGRNKSILARATMAAFEAFVDDALFSVVLPTFAIDVLLAGAFGNGLLMSAVTAGSLVSSGLLLKRAEAIEGRIGVYRFMRALTTVACLAFVPSIALWAGPAGLLAAVPAVFLMKLMTSPLRSRMGVLLQTTIKNDPAAAPLSRKIFSMISFFDVVAAGAGGWLFSSLLLGGKAGALPAVLGTGAPMKLVTLAMAATSLVYLGGLRWIKKQLLTPVREVFASRVPEAQAMLKLEASLKRMGLPAPTAVRVDAEDPDRPTVAILAPASVYKLSIAREGGRQSPGDVHLVLDPSWLIRESVSGGPARLLLKKGLIFDGRQAVVVDYATPRPVHYFANFFTPGANDRDDGVALERDLDVPMSSSERMEHVTNDKLLTRLFLAARGVAVPATLALLMPLHPLGPQAARLGGAATGVRVAALPEGPLQSERVKDAVEDFLTRYSGPEVVVKPSGAQYHSGKGVRFFARQDVAGIVSHALTLTQDPQMTQDGAILIEERLSPPDVFLRTKGDVGGGIFGFIGDRAPMRILKKSELAAAGPKERKDWNVRVLAARTPENGGATTGMFARAGAWGLPTNAETADPDDAAAIIKIEDLIAALREQHGLLKSEEESRRFVEALKALGADAVKALAQAEALRPRQPGEPRRAQTDYIGLDVMATQDAHGRLKPAIIEVNDHDSGGQWQLDELYPERAGEHSREWVATMLARARLDASISRSH